MELSMLASVCLLVVAFPLASGLKCYVCSGTTLTTGCLNSISGVTSTDCPATSPLEAKCLKVYTSTSGAEIVARTCAPQAAGTANSCTTAGVVTTCYCATDDCNGQTTLAPAIVTCFVSLLLALYASW